MRLEAKNIGFRYGRNDWLFRNLSFVVNSGERVGIVAPSGWGKSTLVKLLAGYEKPLEGEILLDGKPLPTKGVLPVQLIYQHPEDAINPRWRMWQVLAEVGIRSGIAPETGIRNSTGRSGAVPEADLVPETGIESGTMRSSAVPETSMVPEVGFESGTVRSGAVPETVMVRGGTVPEALGIEEAWLKRFPRELSGGELQRFCVARALFSGARFLLADEISTMLDAITQAQLWHFLLAEVERRNMGLIVVTHNSALASRVCSQVRNISSDIY
jgi:peptide/nickel transport system ATP-binding protein